MNKTYTLKILPQLLIVGMALTLLGTYLYIPSLPLLPSYFSASADLVQWTMSLHFFGMTLAQLLYGPLSDRWGRKPCLMIGAGLFLLGCSLCAIAFDLNHFFIGRFIQGLGGGAIVVLSVAIVRDVYTPQQSIKILATLGMALAGTLAFGPIIGSYITTWFGWKANFGFLSIVSLINVIVLFFGFKETNQQRRSAASGRLFAPYRQIITHRGFFLYALMTAAVFGGLMAFVTGIPFVFESEFDIGVEDFWQYQCLVIVGYFLGNVVSRMGYKIFKLRGIMAVGIMLVVLGGTFFIYNAYFKSTMALMYCWPMMIYLAGMAFVFATAATKAVGFFPNMRGSAAAMLGAFEMMCSSILSGYVSYFHDGTSAATAIAVWVASLTAMAAWIVLTLTSAKLRFRKPKQ